MKPTRTTPSPKGQRRFSLVSVEAQQEMYQALTALKSARNSKFSGAEVAEIAVCLAAGVESPVVLACAAAGARKVRKSCKVVAAKQNRLVAATSASVDALLQDANASSAIVCIGELDLHPEGLQDFRRAVSFSARHKLPIMFLVANTLTPQQAQRLDLRTLYAEFGVPVFSVDANDAIAAYRVATEALHNARHLRGPCVIEALAIHGAAATSPLELLASYMERHGNPLR